MKKELQKRFSNLELEIAGAAAAAEIAYAEAQLEVLFPKDLRVYLQEFGQLSCEHLEFLGLGPHVPKYLNLVVVARDEWQADLPRHYLPLWNNGGGDLDCVDLKRSSKDKCEIFTLFHDGPKPQHVASGMEGWLRLRLESVL